MDRITIPRSEYLRLRRQANAYQKMAGRLFETVVKDPIQDVVEDFRKTNFYTDGFLIDLEDGLRKSSYGKV